MKNKGYLSLILWITALVLMGSVMGSLTKPQINTWYSTLNRPPFTPPNYIFPIAWTSLYMMIGSCGFLIWRTPSFSDLKLIKRLYVLQLLLNWIWTPLFFSYHLTGFSLVTLAIMDITVSMIIYLSYAKVRMVSLLMTPYLLWILFATYLNLYIWQCN